MSRITMEEIANHVGVSRALVSLAYRDLPGVSAETRARILRAGEELGYTPNQVAARLAGKGGNSIGVFLQDLHNDLFADIYDGIRKVAEAAQKDLVMAVGNLDGSRDAEALDALRRSRVDIIIAAGLQLSDSRVRLINSRVPLVCASRYAKGVDSVVSDDRVGAIAATGHLLELGHKRVMFLSNPPSDGYLERRFGYREAMQGAGLEPWVIESSYSRAVVAEQVGPILDEDDGPTGIFAHNDQAALGVLDALVVRGLRPGRDISVIGYDNSPVGRFPGTALTTVDVNGELLGQQAAELALRRLEKPHASPERLVSLPTLVARNTTGAVVGNGKHNCQVPGSEWDGR